MPHLIESAGEGAIFEWFDRFGDGKCQPYKAETWTILPNRLLGDVRIGEFAETVSQ